MKKLILLAFTLCLFTSVSARPSITPMLITDCYVSVPDTLELYDTLGNMITDGILKVNSSDPDIEAMVGYIWVKNASDSKLSNVYVRRTINQEVAGTQNYFCFGINCYSPATNESSYAVEIDAVTVNKSFYADYIPDIDGTGGHGGLTSVTYEFFDNISLSAPVSAKTTIEFHLSASSISEDKLVFKGPYPNPSSQNAHFEYNLPISYSTAKVSIRNLLGVEVESFVLENGSGKKSIDVSSFPSGIYFYTLLADGNMIQSKKMIVKH